MTENVDAELTVEDILAEAEDTDYHTILQVWTAVLKSSEDVRTERITPQWANRIINAHAQILFEDMPHFRDLYYDKIDQLREVLQAEIDTDDECLNYASPEEDVEHNSIHYLNVIINWQKVILSWELDWDCTHVDAPLELASIVEVHKMFFDQTGLTSLLDNIKFEFSDEHRELLTLELEEMKREWGSNE